MQIYFDQIQRTELLSAQQERELGRLIVRERDPEARHLMIRANLRLVVAVARKYQNRGLPLSDLISEGNLGLLKAVDGFDPEMGVRFSTYATWWIKQAIRSALLQASHAVHCPTYQCERLRHLRVAQGQLADELGRPATPEELAERMDLTPEEMLEFLRMAQPLQAKAQSATAGDDGLSWLDMLCDERAQSPAEILLQQDQVRTVFALLGGMDRREAQVLKLRYGLDDGQPRTFREIGARVGLTHERVRQIESEALSRLHAYMSSDQLTALAGAGAR